jgi:signal transduction histidine kinase
VVEELNLKEQIEEILKNFESKIKRKKLLVNIDVKDDVLVKADKNYFYIFLSNLLYNAIKYNKKGGTIDVIYKEGKLEIKDT